MSKEYRQETAIKYETRIKNILKSAPSYLTDYYLHMHNGKREIATQSAYISDCILFITFLNNILPNRKNEKIKDFPIDIFQEINVKDLNEYRDYLHTEKKLSNSSIKKKFAAISSFYKFINMEKYVENNPIKNFEMPAINTHRIIKLDSELSNQLLQGILKNDKYLIKTEYGESVISIPQNIKLKREKLVLRNYAICCLFLGSGLRVSELVGLDLQDINFRLNSLNIIAKGGDETQVFFGDDVKNSLRLYLDGIFFSNEKLMYYNQFDKSAMDFCYKNFKNINFNRQLKEKFTNKSDEFYNDMELFANSLKRTGREKLNIDNTNKAVFLSIQGKRMTVRMVELMIKEMVKTYLPEYDDKELFSPHKLRATCATRILSQTGDIQLASTQLNHKGIAVTAAFYAEIQKERQKDKVKNLDMKNW